jgi:hypothetical protein
VPKKSPEADFSCQSRKKIANCNIGDRQRDPCLPALIFPGVKVVCGHFTSHGTFNDILMLVNVFLSLIITLLYLHFCKTLQLKTLDFNQQTITMNENVQWQMIKDSVLFALSLGFSVSFLFDKKNSFFFFLVASITLFATRVLFIYTRKIDKNKSYKNKFQ